jgi:hypothetical protein
MPLDKLALLRLVRLVEFALTYGIVSLRLPFSFLLYFLIPTGYLLVEEYFEKKWGPRKGALKTGFYRCFLYSLLALPIFTYVYANGEGSLISSLVFFGGISISLGLYLADILCLLKKHFDGK